MFGQYDVGLYYVQIVDLCWIGIGQCMGKQVSLFLVVVFQVDLVVGLQYCFEEIGQFVGIDQFVGGEWCVSGDLVCVQVFMGILLFYCIIF